MSYINAYVLQANEFRKVLKQPLLSLDNPEDRKRIAWKISNGLSPENLSCDGELSRSETQKRFTFLSRSAKELLALDPTVSITEEF